MSDAHGSGHGGSHGGRAKTGLKRDSIIFVAIISAAIAILYGLVAVLKFSLPQIIFVLLLLWLLVLVSPKVVQYAEYERAIRFRLGRFYKLVGPGLHLIFPYLERDVVVDIRTQILDITPQDVITNDNIRLKIDAVVYYKVLDPKKIILEIQDYKQAMEKLLHAEIRNSISALPLADILDRTDEINITMYKVLHEVAANWGVSVTRVEIENITIPQELAVAMQKRKESQENKVRIETDAQAKQIYLNILNTAVSDLSENTMNYLYLDTLKRVGEGKSSKLIFPLELSKLAENFSDLMRRKN